MSILTLLSSCGSYPVPEGAVPVKPFDKERYLGTWYEVARFDFRFERNLNNTTAQYSLNDDGSIRVVNRGFNYVKGQWKESVGKARFVASPDEARLKVSFFGPFYGGYNVIALDSEYQYALIAGSSLDYLWILSRTKTIPDAVKESYLKQARELGFDVEKLIWVEHTR
jgi:apolipoprotein D and lipocalin family protein